MKKNFMEVTIKGAAGAGKTTLANAIAGVLRGQEKEVLIDEGGNSLTKSQIAAINPDVIIRTKIN